MTAPTAGPAEQLEAVIKHFADHSSPSLHGVGGALSGDVAALRAPGVIRRILMALPIEASSFRSQYPMFDGGRKRLLSVLREWFEVNSRGNLPERDQLVVGTIGVLIMTLHGLIDSERVLEGPITSSPQQGSSATCCAAVVRSASVKAVLGLVYGEDDGDASTQKDWSDAIAKTWHFHRHGSTSVLIRTVGDSASDVAALKLVLPPYLRIREIRDATRLYKSRYQIPHADHQPESWPHLVDVYASTERWILMSFVDGTPLADQLTPRRTRNREAKEENHRPVRLRERLKDLTTKNEPRPAASARGLADFVRLKKMREVGLGLFAALLENYEASSRTKDRPIAHGDLTPSNVIVTESGAYVLIDHGPNYLFTRAAGVGAVSESIFVAPEVRENETDTDLADLYSLAQIVILAGGLKPNASGLVPDELYMWHPAIARLFEDYLDARPRRRINYLGDKAYTLSAARLERLQAQFAFELDMAIAYQEDPGVVASRWPQMLVEQRLWNGEPRRNRVLLRKARDWPEPSDHGPWADRSKIREYVEDQRRQLVAQRRWSFITALVTTLSATCVVWWLLGDIPRPIGNPIANAVLGWVDPPEVPLVDRLYREGGKIHDPDNWPARVVALSYALLAAKIYHSLYARISPLRARRTPGFGALSVLATVWIRGMPLLNAALVLWATLVSANDWPKAVIIGQVLAAFGNLAVVGFLLRALNEARGPDYETAEAHVVSTVPRSDTEVTGLDLVASWVPSSWFYAVVCTVVGILIVKDVLQDDWLYAAIVAFLNLGLLYAVKCGRNGPKMRVALHRATFAAERVGLDT